MLFQGWLHSLRAERLGRRAHDVNKKCQEACRNFREPWLLCIRYFISGLQDFSSTDLTFFIVGSYSEDGGSPSFHIAIIHGVWMHCRYVIVLHNTFQGNTFFQSQTVVAECGGCVKKAELVNGTFICRSSEFTTMKTIQWLIIFQMSHNEGDWLGLGIWLIHSFPLKQQTQQYRN